MKTRVFAYNGIVGILSSPTAEGLVNDPSKPGQIGFVVLASHVEISEEALAALAKVPKSGDCIGDVDAFASAQGAVFSWLGGPLRIINPSNVSGSRDWDVKLLRKFCIIVPNDPPEAFVSAVSKYSSK